MTRATIRPARINREMAGVPIQFEQRTLQPVAHVTGWSGAWGRTHALRARPVEVLVTDGDGRTYRVPITVEKNGTVRWLALAGALVLPLNWLVRRALARRRLA